MHPRIMIEIASTHWAITEEALRGIVKAVESSLDEEDRPRFHSATEEEREAITDVLGEAREEGNRYSAINGKIGTLLIDGPIIPRSSNMDKFSGLVAINALTKEFEALEADDAIEEIVLFMDTPGGAVKGISEFSRLVASSSKPVTAYVFGMAASAGYWIASAADRIISADTGIVGSIGVVQTIRLNDQNQFVEIVSRQSPNKRIDPSSKQGKRQIEDLLSDLADIFIEAVAENRNVTPETVVEKFGKGGVFAAAKAKSVGMIDGIADLSMLVEGLQNGNVTTIEEAAIEDDLEEETETDRGAVQSDIEPEELEDDKKEKSEMDLKTLIKEHPEIAAEIDEIEAAAKKAGRQEMIELHEEVSSFMGNDNYPESVDALAKAVLSGDEPIDKLRGAVSAIDSVRAADSEDDAEKELEDVDETPPEEPPTLSEDGEIRNEDDYQAAIASIRSIEA